MHLLYLVSVLEGLETSKVVSAQERLCSQKFQFFLTSKKETVYDPLLTYIKICCCAQPLPPKKIPAFAGKIRSNLQFSEVGGLFCKVGNGPTHLVLFDTKTRHHWEICLMSRTWAQVFGLCGQSNFLNSLVWYQAVIDELAQYYTYGIGLVLLHFYLKKW